MAEFTPSKSNGSASSSSFRPSSSSTSSLSSPSLSSAKSDIVSNVRDSLKGAYSTVQEKAQSALSSSGEFVKANPIRTVLGAAAVGFLAGMIARRKH